MIACLRGGFCCLAIVACVSAWADDVWVALSGKHEAYVEAARALQATLPNAEVRVGVWSEFDFNTPLPKLLVTVGGEALSRLRATADKTRIVAVLAPRSQLDEVFDAADDRITGVYYEQSFSRLASLLHNAFPKIKRVGIVLGPASSRYRNELSSAFRKVGMEGVFATIEKQSELSSAMNDVLADASLFLALPDAAVINAQTAKFVLLATYRRGIPVAGYSAAFVKSGAAIAMVSSPTQIGKEAGRMVAEAMTARTLPAPRPAEDFDVLVNSSVSRSMNLNLDASQLEKFMRDEGRRR
jgi:ABC-type uncharacterized transport system substrate-binding protein